MDTLLKNTRDWLQTSTRRSFSAVLEEAKITPRQVEICELKFVKGLTNYQIAMQLNVSVKTVDKELNTAYKQITNVLSFLLNATSRLLWRFFFYGEFVGIGLLKNS